MARIVSLGLAFRSTYVVDKKLFSTAQSKEETMLSNIVPGTSSIADKITFSGNGGGLNTAICFARHGHETILFSSIAKDDAGKQLVSLLNQENIDNSYLSQHSHGSTGSSVILVNSKTNQRTTFQNFGVSDNFDDFTESNLDSTNPDWLYISTMNGNLNVIRRLAKHAQKIGTKVALNPGPLELSQIKKLISVLTFVDLLIVNKTEAAEVIPSTNLTELLYHLNNYVKNVIITDGIMGGIASNRQETYRFGIYEDVAVKDLSGAGDAFGSGFLAHFSANHSFSDALIFASANATSVITKIGPSQAILTNKESLHYMPIQKL